jgi:hypothetical protein
MNNIEQIALFVMVSMLVYLAIESIQERITLKIRASYVDRIKKLKKELQQLSTEERNTEYGIALKNELFKIMFEYSGKYEQ